MDITIVKSEYSFEKLEQFSTFEELSQRLSVHCKNDFVYYWRRDSRTVEGAHLKTSRPISKKLKYYSVKYACVFGGQKFTTRGRGERSTHNQTKRMDCPAFISFRASKCGEYLQVMDVCNQHNHEISEEAIKQIPHHRRLSPDVKEEVLYLLAAKVDRNDIVRYVQLRAEVELIPKTINNFMLEVRAQKHNAMDNVLVGERIQQFLELHQIILTTAQTDSDCEATENDEQPQTLTECLNNDEQMDDIIIETAFDTVEMMENWDPIATDEGELVPDDAIRLSETTKKHKRKSRKNLCVNCLNVGNSQRLNGDIQRLRAEKRKLINELNVLKRKKYKLINCNVRNK